MIIMGSIKELETAAMAFRLARIDVQSENDLKDLSDVLVNLDLMIYETERSIEELRFEENRLKF